MKINNKTGIPLPINDTMIKPGEHQYRNIDHKDSATCMQLGVLRGMGMISFQEILERDNVRKNVGTTEGTGRDGTTDTSEGNLPSKKTDESVSGGSVPERRDRKHKTVKVRGASGEKASKMGRSSR